MTTPNSPAASSELDLSALRLPTNYGATLGVKKALVAVPIGKPRKGSFFRVREGEEWRISVFIFERKEENETYVVLPGAAAALGQLVRPAQLHAAIDRQNNPFLIPLPLPGEDGRWNPWHESLAQAIQRSVAKWVRIEANRHLGAYDVLEAQGELPEPDWPDVSLQRLVEVAFRNKIISDSDHPVVQQCLGLV